MPPPTIRLYLEVPSFARTVQPMKDIEHQGGLLAISHDDMVNSLESLEEKFRRVEEANERRALDESDLSQSELVDPSIEQRKHRWKQGLSVTQFGQHSDEQGESSSYSPATASLSAVASKSTFYHTLANPRSLESLITENSGDEMRYTEDNHVTEVERIAGRQTLPKSVGALLPRRALTRSQTLYIPKERSMVIDVSVEHTMNDSPHAQAEAKPKTSMAYAARPSRRRAATLGIVSHGSLMERAKDFARKLRHKSKAEPPLPPRGGCEALQWCLDACMQEIPT